MKPAKIGGRVLPRHSARCALCGDLLPLRQTVMLVKGKFVNVCGDRQLCARRRQAGCPFHGRTG